MKRIILMILGAFLLYVVSCDENETDPYRDYFEYSSIDTVLVGDTIRNGASAPIVHVYPMGCNHFERIESRENGDTLALAALYHYHYLKGYPCAHGSGPDTTSYSLHFSASGTHYLYYRRSESIRIAQPVYVEE
jgi:hypothetical protein